MSHLINYACDTCCALIPEAWCTALINRVERYLKLLGPLFALLAASLVMIDAYVFFTTVLTEVDRAHGHFVSAVHALIGAWLLFNVMFNHLFCAISSPGTTLEADPQELRLAATHTWRYCSKCERGKPPLCHHCSICNKCVLKMDHHCPWTANCIGFNNYRFFFLYLWWMWVGSIYSIVMIYGCLRHLPTINKWVDHHFLAFLAIVLSFAVFLGIGMLLGWHIWLVLTGQGTIDSMGTYRNANGQPCSNPYDLGVIANIQETFDVHGRFWWLTWMLPTWRCKRGHGYRLPTRARAEHSSALMSA